MHSEQKNGNLGEFFLENIDSRAILAFLFPILKHMIYWEKFGLLPGISTISSLHLGGYAVLIIIYKWEWDK